MARLSAAWQCAERFNNYNTVKAERGLKSLPNMCARRLRPALLSKLLPGCRFARRFGMLAEGEGRREGSGNEPDRRAPPPDDLRDSRIAAEPSEDGSVRQRPTEDPVAQARRHVAEAEGHIVRQEALVARLSGDARHVALAVQARVILATLRQTLRLAREHLALELKK